MRGLIHSAAGLAFAMASLAGPAAVAQTLPDDLPEWQLPPDSSIRQVQIEVWISETGEQGLRDIGANLYYHRFVRGVEQSGTIDRVVTDVFDPRNPNYQVTVPAPTTPAGNPVFEGSTPPPSSTPLRPDRVDGNVANGIQTQAGGGITFDIIDTDRGTLHGVFRAIERTSDLDLISKPEVLVVDRHTAVIHAGGEVPVQDIGYDRQGQAQLNVKWERIGVELELEPQVLDDNLIRLNVHKLEVRDVLRIDRVRGVDLPVFSTRRQNGPVLVPNGQTLVMGGLTSRVDRRTERKVPLIGDLPLFGIPFRGRQTESSISTLLIFISPTVVDLRELRQDSIDALNFWQRSEWQYRDRIEREIDVLESEY